MGFFCEILNWQIWQICMLTEISIINQYFYLTNIMISCLLMSLDIDFKLVWKTGP